MAKRSIRQKIILGEPDIASGKFRGESSLADQLKAAWTLLPGGEFTMNPTLVGPPGSGKTVLALECAGHFQKDAYIFQCTSRIHGDLFLFTALDTPEGEDLPATPLLTAMLGGAVCIFENAETLSTAAWFELKSLLDNRRYLLSQILGKRLEPLPGFRLVFLMTTRNDTPPVPEQILSEIMPVLEVSSAPEDIESIIKAAFFEENEEVDTISREILKKTAHYITAGTGVFSVSQGQKIFAFCKNLAQAGRLSVDVAFERAVSLFSEK